MATARYRLTAVLAFLLVAATVAVGWQGGHRPGERLPRVVPSALTGQVAAAALPSAGTWAMPDAVAATAGSPVPATSNPAAATGSPAPATGSPVPARRNPAAATGSPAAPGGPAAGTGSAAAAARSLTLSPSALRSCPAAATACVDLSDHLTWLQSDGHITYGPVRMEPGAPGTPEATPRGTFRVQWKAGPTYISTEYGEPMPYAVFFAPGGVAFHGGSLTRPSHGCVHLDIGSARYYHDHLPIGAEVVVF
jgi:lipoprotein-anchoring transpeptidase ErfK/SrfK